MSTADLDSSPLPTLAILLRRIHAKAEQRNKYARWDLHRSYYFVNQNGIHNEIELARALEHFHVTLGPRELTLLYHSFPSQTIKNGFDYIAFANSLYPPAKNSNKFFRSVVPQEIKDVDLTKTPSSSRPSTALSNVKSSLSSNNPNNDLPIFTSRPTTANSNSKKPSSSTVVTEQCTCGRGKYNEEKQNNEFVLEHNNQTVQILSFQAVCSSQTSTVASAKKDSSYVSSRKPLPIVNRRS